MIYQVRHRGQMLAEFLSESHATRYASSYNKIWARTTWHGAEVVPARALFRLWPAVHLLMVAAQRQINNVKGQ